MSLTPRIYAVFGTSDDISDGHAKLFTIMWFESWEAVKLFAGKDYEKAYVPPKARKVLARFDGRSQHYEIRERITY